MKMFHARHPTILRTLSVQQRNRPDDGRVALQNEAREGRVLHPNAVNPWLTKKIENHHQEGKRKNMKLEGVPQMQECQNIAAPQGARPLLPGIPGDVAQVCHRLEEWKDDVVSLPNKGNKALLQNKNIHQE
jgi:hypothetical protein